MSTPELGRLTRGQEDSVRNVFPLPMRGIVGALNYTQRVVLFLAVSLTIEIQNSTPKTLSSYNKSFPTRRREPSTLSQEIW